MCAINCFLELAIISGSGQGLAAKTDPLHGMTETTYSAHRFSISSNFCVDSH